MGKLNLPISLFYPSLSPVVDSSRFVCKLAFSKRLALENCDLEVALSNYTEKLKDMKWLFSDTCINHIVHGKAFAGNILTVMEIVIRTLPVLSCVVVYRRQVKWEGDDFCRKYEGVLALAKWELLEKSQ